MATWPTYARLLFEGFQESPDSALLTTEMEDGPAKVRRVKSRVMVKRSAVVLLRSRASYVAFCAWFADAAGANRGAAWITWRDPVSGTTKQVRIVGGLIQGVPQSPALDLWKVPLTLESWDA